MKTGPSGKGPREGCRRFGTPSWSGLVRWVVVVGLLSMAVACGARGGAPPEAGETSGAVPALSGRSVMVLPVQGSSGMGDLARDVDAEIRYALRSRSDQVRWSFPEDLRDALARSPGLDVPLESLPVGAFLQAEVQRVGDPLFGQLRRLGAVADGELALVPVSVRRNPVRDGGDGADAVPAELVTALIQVRDGRVAWFGVVEGDPGREGDFGLVASLAEALGATLFP